MKLSTDEHGNIVLEEVFNGVVLKTAAGETMIIQMRDSEFEFEYEGVKYFAKEGHLKPFPEYNTETVKEFLGLGNITNPSLSGKIAVEVDLQQSKLLCGYLGLKHDLGDFSGVISIYINKKNYLDTGSEICWDFTPNVNKQYTVISFSEYSKGRIFQGDVQKPFTALEYVNECVSKLNVPHDHKYKMECPLGSGCPFCKK